LIMGHRNGHGTISSQTSIILCPDLDSVDPSIAQAGTLGTQTHMMGIYHFPVGLRVAVA
jgi:hypothetical protein